MKRRNTVAIKMQVLFHRGGVWDTSILPHNSEPNNRCHFGWHRKSYRTVFIHLFIIIIFFPLAIMHVYYKENFANMHCFYICRS